jgi:hypothetical protein
MGVPPSYTCDDGNFPVIAPHRYPIRTTEGCQKIDFAAVSNIVPVVMVRRVLQRAEVRGVGTTCRQLRHIGGRIARGMAHFPIGTEEKATDV